MPHLVSTILIVLFAVSFVGCGMSRIQPPSASGIVVVDTPARVAGLWKGTTWRVSRLWSDGDVRVSIAPGGRYVAWRDQGRGLAVEAGRLLAIEGKLMSETESFISTFTLVQHDDHSALVVEVTGKEGDHVYVPLVRDVP